MAVSNSGASLSAVTSTGAGAAITFTTVCSRHAHAITVTGFTGTGTARVRLEISMDDATWFPIDRGGNKVITGNGTYYARSEEDYPALYVRSNLTEIDSTVTAISVSSIVASE